MRHQILMAKEKQAKNAEHKLFKAGIGEQTGQQRLKLDEAVN